MNCRRDDIPKEGVATSQVGIFVKFCHRSDGKWQASRFLWRRSYLCKRSVPHLHMGLHMGGSQAKKLARCAVSIHRNEKAYSGHGLLCRRQRMLWLHAVKCYWLTVGADIAKKRIPLHVL